MNTDLTQMLRERDALSARIRAAVEPAARAVERAHAWHESAHGCLTRIALSADATQVILSWEFSDEYETTVTREYLALDELSHADAVFLRFRRMYRHRCRECGHRESENGDCSACHEATEVAWFDSDDSPEQVALLATFLIANRHEDVYAQEAETLTEKQLAGLTTELLEPLLAIGDRNVREAAQAALARVQRPPRGRAR